MPTSTDFPTNLNPAYQKERKPETGKDFIDVPVYDQDENRLEDERITFEYEQYGRDMIIWMGLQPYYAHIDDVKNAFQDLYKNFNIEYK